MNSIASCSEQQIVGGRSTVEQSHSLVNFGQLVTMADQTTKKNSVTISNVDIQHQHSAQE
jgi:hypothetical protein